MLYHILMQLQDQFSHCDSDWRRFLYDSLSLCEHIITRTTTIRICSAVKTLTIIMSSIFSLDSTDGQSEITVRSTATESRWSSWLKGACSINQEFRSFSRFLWVPAQKVCPRITEHICAGFTADFDCFSWSSCCRWGTLSDADLSSTLWNTTRRKSTQNFDNILEEMNWYQTCAPQTLSKRCESPDEDDDEGHVDEDCCVCQWWSVKLTAL